MRRERGGRIENQAELMGAQKLQLHTTNRQLDTLDWKLLYL